MPRTVVIHASTNNLVGDETYEAWLKHESDAWALVDAGDVEQISGTQSFTFPGLVDGADYSLQLRMKRAGRYRIGYLGADPESWPGQSRLDFTVGSLIDVGAPTLTAVDDWTRVDADHSKFVIHLTPNSLTVDIELVRDGAVVHTFAQPHSGPIVYDDVDVALAADHTWKARHVAGTLGGPFSAEITKYAGPDPVTNLHQDNDFIRYNDYDAAWEGPVGPYRVEDNAEGSYTVLTASTMSQFINRHIGMTEVATGPTVESGCLIRVRREITAFGVTDVSAWVEAGMTYEVDA